MINLNTQLELFKIIGKELKEKVECVVIGGSAMMFYNAKESTKDVDLVFTKKNDLNKVKEVLYNSGFGPRKEMIKIFRRYEVTENTPVMMVGKDTRFDLFLNEIICFRLSSTMLQRVREVHEFGNFIVKVVSPEDIILLKCATERAKDRVDAAELIKRFNINWEIILEESLNQTKLGKGIFPVFLYEFLLELKEDLKAEVPKEVLNKTMKIAEREMIKAMKKGKLVREK